MPMGYDSDLKDDRKYMTTDEEPKAEETPATEDQFPRWKLMPMLVIATKTLGPWPNSKIMDISLLQYAVEKFGGYARSWILNPGEIDWDHPDVIQTLQDIDFDRETLQSAPSMQGLLGLMLSLQAEAAVWCGHRLTRTMELIRQEFERGGIPLATTEGKLILDLEVLDQGLHPGMESYDLAAVAGRWEVELGDGKGALHDAVICKQIFKAMMDKLPDNPFEMRDLNDEWTKRFAERG